MLDTSKRASLKSSFWFNNTFWLGCLFVCGTEKGRPIARFKTKLLWLAASQLASKQVIANQLTSYWSIYLAMNSWISIISSRGKRQSNGEGSNAMSLERDKKWRGSSVHPNVLSIDDVAVANSNVQLSFKFVLEGQSSCAQANVFNWVKQATPWGHIILHFSNRNRSDHRRCNVNSATLLVRS